MSNYSNIKDLIIYETSTFKWTIKDFIDNIDIFLKDTEKFEKTVFDILNKNNPIITKKLMNISSTFIIRIIIDLIKRD